MEILEDPTLIFCKRKGTTNKGSDYENLIVAKITLSLTNDDTVKDFKIWSNDDNFGLFDDVVLEIEFVDGNIQKYAIQVKYSNDGRVLTKTSLSDHKGNFSIEKYHENFKKFKIGEYRRVVYTNRKFDVSNKFDGDKSITLDNFKLTIEQTEDRLNSGRCFRFASCPPDVFFDNFILFTNQTDVDDIRKSIENHFRQVFNCQNYSFKQYLDFITEWSNLEGKKVKLCKHLIQHKIAIILLSEWIRPLIVNGANITPHMSLLKNLLMKCKIISFTEDVETIVASLWRDLDLEELKPTLTKLSRWYQIPMENIFILLWLMGKCPLIITQNPVALKAISFCPDRSFIILDDSQATKLSHFEGKLLNDILTTFKCSLQGKDNISLKDLISGGQLIEQITIDDLVKMVDAVWCIGEKENLPFPYIGRSLTRHIFDWKVLEMIDFGLMREAFILITNYKDCMHMKHSTMNSESFYDVKETNWEFCNGKVIFVTDGEYTAEQFDEICDLNGGKSEYYQFRLSGDYLELVRSKGNPSKYQMFLQYSGVPIFHQDSYVTESQLIHYQSDNKIHIICAGPGMGKTTLMKSVKNDTSPTSFTILIYVRNHCGYFISKDVFMEHILSHTDISIRRLLATLVKENRVEYIWDGLDEVSSHNVSNILDLIENLGRTGCQQWITSRDNLKQLLEIRFNVLSRTLIEFNESDQKRYIKQRLQCSEHDFGDIFEKIKRNIHLLPTNNILGIPLQIYLLTELFRTDRTTYENLIEKVFSVADLYEHFVDEKFNIYCTEKENVACANDMFNERNSVFKQQQIELYERLAARKFGFVDTEVKLLINADRIGIMSIRDDLIEFVHTSFAEYFAACFLAKNPDVAVKLAKFLSNDRYNNVRFFFDLLLAKNCPAHVAVIYKNTELFLSCTEDEICRLDRGGRNVLHLVCSWSQKIELVNVMKTQNGYTTFQVPMSYATDKSVSQTSIICYLSKICDPASKDDLYGFSSLDYAYNSRCLMVYIKLLPTPVDFGDLEEVLACSLICCCVVSDFADVFRLVKNIPHIEVSYLGNLTELAARHDSIKCLKYLANRYYDDIPNFTKTLYERGHSDSVKYFIDNYSHVNLKEIALKATEKGHVNILEYLLSDKCVDVNLYEGFWHGGTLLYISSKLGLTSNVPLLIHYKADVNAPDHTGRTPLHVALTSEIAKILLDSDADVNSKDSSDNTPLHIHAGKNIDTVKLLLEYQSDVNCRNKQGRVPLHIACQEGKFKIVQLLIQNGADVNHVNEDGNRPIHSACVSKDIHIFQLLVDSGADINATNIFGEQPIHLVSEEGCFDVVRFLVGRGSAVNSITTYNETPLEMASNDKVFQFLKNHGAKTYSDLQLLAE